MKKKFSNDSIHTNTIIIFCKTILLLSFFTGCSQVKFKSEITDAKNDLLSEESFMRYNSSRLDDLEIKKENFVQVALKNCHQEKFTKGLDLLIEQTDKNKKNPEFWNAIGTCYLLNSNKSKAQFYYNLALEANANSKDLQKDQIDSMIKNNLALILLESKRTNEAFDLLSEVIKKTPDFQTPKFNIAQIYLEYHQNENAIKIFEELKTRNNHDTDVQYALGVLYFRIKNYKKSYEALANIDSKYKKRADIAGLLALNLFQQKKYEEAKDVLKNSKANPIFDKRNNSLITIVENKIEEEKQKLIENQKLMELQESARKPTSDEKNINKNSHEQNRQKTEATQNKNS